MTNMVSDLLQDRCGACAEGISQPFPFTMAFQPVVDLKAQRIYAYEALVRGPRGEGAGWVLDQVTPANRYRFDQSCRVKAIALASRLGLQQQRARLSINFIPGAMYDPENCVRATLAAARRHGLPAESLVFELTENERITDHAHLRSIFAVYKANRFRVALDDFGAGYAGLSLLAEFRPDVIKLDMALIRGLDASPARQAIIAGVLGICQALHVAVVAEGVETEAELAVLRAMGVTLAQGYLFARPAFECLPPVSFLVASSPGAHAPVDTAGVCTAASA